MGERVKANDLFYGHRCDVDEQLTENKHQMDFNSN